MKRIFVTFLTALIVSIAYLNFQTLDTALSEKEDYTENTQRYSDVESDAWFAPYIEELSKDGIVKGYPDGRYGAWDPVNRAELAKIIVLLKTELKGHWFKDNIMEIALVLATLFGWLYIISAFKKSTEEMTYQLIRFQERQQDPTQKPQSNPKAEHTIEKNLKSNWWV